MRVEPRGRVAKRWQLIAPSPLAGRVGVGPYAASSRLSSCDFIASAMWSAKSRALPFSMSPEEARKHPLTRISGHPPPASPFFSPVTFNLFIENEVAGTAPITAVDSSVEQRVRSVAGKCNGRY